MDRKLGNLDQLQREGDALLASEISGIKASAAKIALFGAGEAGRLIKTFLNSHGVFPVYFIDNFADRWDTEFDGIKVKPPAFLHTINDVFVIICSWDVDGIADQMRRMNIVSYDASLYVKLISLQRRGIYSDNIAHITGLAGRLADDRSRQVLFGLVEHAFSLDNDILNQISDPDQYFMDARFNVRPRDVIVDGGAFRGDTVADIVARFGRIFQTIHCFEPNAANYEQLVRYIKEHGLGDCVAPHNVGLSDRKKALEFSGREACFSVRAGSEADSEQVDLVSLDEVLLNTPEVHFIKMDVEGAEVSALSGAKKIIKRDLPRLAICVYHAPEHLWGIPLFIASLAPEYRLYLRHHTRYLYETVAYAIAG